MGLTTITEQDIRDRLAAGMPVELGPGTWEFSTTITVRDGAYLKGAGPRTRFVVKSGVDLFTISGANECYFSSFRVEHQGTTTGRTFLINSASNDITIERVKAINAFNLVKTTGSSGTRNSSINVKDCWAKSTLGLTATASQYGFIFEWTDDITVENCRAQGYRLDGLKFGGDNSGMRVIGGRFWDNGYLSGDGIDAYTGGEQLTIIGTQCDSNGLNATGSDAGDTGGAGIQIKVGPLSGASGVGHPHNVQIIGVSCRGNADHGLIINRSDPSTTSEGWVSGVSVIGGVFELNGQQGIYLRGRAMTVVGAICRQNATDGIQVSTFSQEVALLGCLLLGNGSNTSSDAGVEVNGNSCQIAYCIFNGKDVTSAGDATAVAAGSQKARYGVRITSAVPGGPGGTNVAITGAQYANHSVANEQDDRT